MDIRRAMPSSSFLPSLFFFFLLSLNTHLCSGSNSITPTLPLTATQTITSNDSVFELGFFTPSNSSQNSYIGIWYKKVSIRTIVWVANRETPLPNTTNSFLKISEDGNLVLLSPTNLPIWSTNLTSLPSNSTAAVLLDSGNLVLTDGADPSIIHWRSFDHPTDTWLPGGRLGLNKVSGKNQRLTSWKTKEDPAPGTFSLEIDPNESTQYLLVWNGTERYWTSGVWDGHIFSQVPEMTANYIYNFSFVNNETFKYFTYSLYNPSTLTRFLMDVQGQIKQLTWLQGPKEWNQFWSQPRSYCEVYALCGAFGICTEKSSLSCTCLPGFIPKFQKDWALGSWSDGCVRKTPLQPAENGTSDAETDRFRAVPDVKISSSHSQSLSVGSAEECKSACLNNRSCTAYALQSGCSLWYGDLVDLQQLSDESVEGKTLFLRLAASEVPISSSRKATITKVVVGSVAGVVFALGIVLFLIWRRQRQGKMVSLAATAEGSLVAFSYRNLQLVTKNFSEKLGSGGFGSVFKGWLPDLTMVAVKKLEGLRQGEKQFRTEVSTIGTIQHVNLIRLRGFCSEGNKKLLVYDYMPNGSLDSHLFGTASSSLDWQTRYQIAVGTARGLAYLHEKCRDCIIHCDIKPENILLDSEFSPKIADFGLAKLVGREFSRVLTTMRGTRGYLAPEWISGLPITPKADVYSYGMMVLEIISGRRNADQSVTGETMFFPYWATRKIAEGEVQSLLDVRLEGEANTEELCRVCRVACWCIQDDEDDRPSMGQIVQILEGVVEVRVPPIPRSLQILAQNHNMVFSSLTPSNASKSSGSKTTSSSSSTKDYDYAENNHRESRLAMDLNS